MKTQYTYSNLKRITYTLDFDEIKDILLNYVMSKAEIPGGAWFMDVDEDDLGLLQIKLFQDFLKIVTEHND